MEEQKDKRNKFSSILLQLRDRIEGKYIEELKMEPTCARAAADMALEAMRENVSGSAIYIAKGHLWAITERHRRIYRRFTGANHAELAREFDLTERQIYNIIEQISQEEFNRRQGRLFD